MALSKSASWKRVSSFLALASMFGQGLAQEEMESKYDRRTARRIKSPSANGAFGGVKRAGIKLARKYNKYAVEKLYNSRRK